jgi:hypothetical protein
MKTLIQSLPLIILAGCTTTPPVPKPTAADYRLLPPFPTPTTAGVLPSKMAMAPKPMVSQNSYTPSNAPASVALAWDLSPDPRVSGYHVFEGASSRNYTNLLDAGNTNFAAFGNLVRGSTYYFAATCYATNGQESDFSAEVAYTVPAPILPPTGFHLLVLTVQASTNLINWATVIGPFDVAADADRAYYRALLNVQTP